MEIGQPKRQAVCKKVRFSACNNLAYVLDDEKSDRAPSSEEAGPSITRSQVQSGEVKLRPRHLQGVQATRRRKKTLGTKQRMDKHQK